MSIVLPIRLLKLIKHLFLIDFNSPRNEKWWFWFALLPFKCIDCLLIPEFTNLVIVLFKFNSRFLTNIEMTELKTVYANNIPFWKISIDESSLFAHLGAKINKSKTLGVVVINTINFNCKLNFKPQNSDMKWLVHELAHILQFNEVGSGYIFYALYAQHTSGYKLPSKQLANLNLYNFEQQAEIARYSYSGDKDYKALNKEIVGLKFV